MSDVNKSDLDSLSLPPGSELAEALEGLIPFAMSDGELVDALAAFRRLTSWSRAGELAVIAELARRRPPGVSERPIPLPGTDADDSTSVGGRIGPGSVGEFLIDEIAAALTLTGNSAAWLVDMALTMDRRLPATFQALRTGQIDYDKARVVALGTSAVNDQVAKSVEHRVLDKAPGQTTAQLRARVSRAVINADPDAARKRREAAEATRDVTCRPDRDGAGTADLAGVNLPADQAIAAANRLNALARGFKATGDPRRLGTIRADVFLALLLGLTPTPPTPEPPAPDPAKPTPTEPREIEREWDERGWDEAQIVERRPVRGTGLRQPQGWGEASPWYERVHHDRYLDPYEAGDDVPVQRTGQIAGQAAARVGTVNLTIPLSAYLGLDDAPAEVIGYGPLLADVARLLAAHASDPGTAWCITLTDDQGRPIRHGTTAYRPPPALRRMIEARNPTCAFPTCRRPARACDIDHTVPYDEGGITCGCNTAPLCRRHHRVKQAAGWSLVQREPGHLEWTLPSGKRYLSAPEPQPG